MAVLKYKNPNYVVGGTEEKYLPLFNVIVSSSEVYVGETEPTNGEIIWINPIDNITKYKYNDTWIVLINFQETVTISLVSNQDESAVPDADLLGKSVHVIYGDQDKELIWNGDTMQTTVPMEMSYQVVFPTDDRYKCPDNQEYIALAGDTREVKGYYYTEVVKVTVSSVDSSSVIGQKVTINGIEYAWSGETIEVKIPHNVEYSVSVSAKAGYITPTTVTTTASRKENEINMQYMQIEVNTITIDQTISDPATMISGDVNGEMIQWIRNNSHRVLAKQTSDGILTYCRLDDANSNNYYNGSAAVLTGSEGDVFMKMPEFYYKGVNYDLTHTKVQMFFAREKLDNDYIRWNPNTLIGVYEAYIEESRMYSRSGVASTGNVGQGTCKTAAANRGDGYQLVDWQMHCIMGCLYYAMYGNTDCQNSIGKGTDAYNKPTGQTNNLGMNDTVAGGNGDNQSINYWGLENWWGNKFEWIHDYINEANTNTAYVNDPAGNGTRGWYINLFNGYYPKKMSFGRYLDLYASPHDPANNNSATTGYCDYQYWAQSSTLSNSVLKRSGNNSKTLCGVAYAGTTRSTSSAETGSRLAFRGVCIEEPDVEKFKAITITN